MSTARTRRGRSGGTRRRTSSRPVRAGARTTADARPGRRRTRGAPRSAVAAVRRGSQFTGRAIVLVVLVLLLALTLAGPIRQYVAGRQHLASLAAERDDLADRAAELQAQLDRQSDPAYIAQQARQRLTYVLPGDRLVVVGNAGAAGDSAAAPAAGTAGKKDVPWYEGLLGSVAAADGDPGTGR